MPDDKYPLPAKLYWQLTSVAALACLLYFGWLMLPGGGLLASANRLLLAIVLLLAAAIAAGFVYNHKWLAGFQQALARRLWRVSLAFLAFTLAIGAAYLTWLSYITSDGQWYGILLRLRPLLLWLVFAGLLGLFWFRAPQQPSPSPKMKSSPAVTIGLVAITLLGLMLRLKFINYPAHFDEVMSYLRFASGSAWTAVSFYPAPNNHVLHSLLVLLITRLFVGGLPAIRLAAFSAGLLSIPVVYWLGRRIYDPYVGLLAAGLLAVSSYHIQYSVNGRGHALIVFFVLLALLLAERIRRDPSPGNWLWFTLLCVLGFATIPVMLYAYLGILLWLSGSYLLKDVSPRNGRLFPLYLVFSGLSATLLTLLFYSPILLSSGWGALSGNAFVDSSSWSAFMGKLPGFLTEVWATWLRDLPPGAGLLIGAGILLSLLQHKRMGRSKLWLGYPLLLGCAIVLFAQRAIPFTRVWLFLLPLALLLAAAGWIGLVRYLWPGIASKPWPVVAVIVLLCLGLALPVSRSPHIYLERETGSLPQGDQVAEFLIERVEASDVVLSNRPAYLILDYYFQRAGLGTSSQQSWQPGQRTDNIYMVVNEFYGENINIVLNTTDLAGQPGLTPPQLLRQFEGAAVYLVEIQP